MHNLCASGPSSYPNKSFPCWTPVTALSWGLSKGVDRWGVSIHTIVLGPENEVWCVGKNRLWYTQMNLMQQCGNFSFSYSRIGLIVQCRYKLPCWQCRYSIIFLTRNIEPSTWAEEQTNGLFKCMADPLSTACNHSTFVLDVGLRAECFCVLHALSSADSQITQTTNQRASRSSQP